MRGNAEFVLSLSAIASALIETQMMIVANKVCEKDGKPPEYDALAFWHVQNNMQDTVSRLASFIGDT